MSVVVPGHEMRAITCHASDVESNSRRETILHIRRIGPQTLQDNNLAAAAFDFYAGMHRR